MLDCNLDRWSMSTSNQHDRCRHGHACVGMCTYIRNGYKDKLIILSLYDNYRLISHQQLAVYLGMGDTQRTDVRIKDINSNNCLLWNGKSEMTCSCFVLFLLANKRPCI